MKHIYRLLLIAIICTGFSACDFTSISVGNWQTQTALKTRTLQSNWTINPDESLTSTGDWRLSVNTVELDGSRIAFNATIPLTENQLIDGNFSGTVSGNSLQGTFFTTEGNFTVSGQRQ